MRDGKHLILCIDDDEDILYAMGIVLESAGYEVAKATSGEQGLKVYHQTEPDLVIVDLMMEEIDSGVDFAKELRAIGNTAPVFMLSSVGDGLSMTTDYSQLGLAGILQKPIDKDNLLELLKSKL